MSRAALNQSTPADDAHSGPVPGAGWPADIVELIMADHRRIRRLRGALQDAVRHDRDAGPGWILTHTWQRFTGLLVAHFDAEEEICYLPMFGPGPQAAGRRREAIADHDDIREAVREASLHRVGSARWWRAAMAVLAGSDEHLDREECGVLAEGLIRLTMSQRRALGRQWSAFTAAWAQDSALQARWGVSRAGQVASFSYGGNGA